MKIRRAGDHADNGGRKERKIKSLGRERGMIRLAACRAKAVIRPRSSQRMAISPRPRTRKPRSVVVASIDEAVGQHRGPVRKSQGSPALCDQLHLRHRRPQWRRARVLARALPGSRGTRCRRRRSARKVCSSKCRRMPAHDGGGPGPGRQRAFRIEPQETQGHARCPWGRDSRTPNPPFRGGGPMGFLEWQWELAGWGLQSVSRAAFRGRTWPCGPRGNGAMATAAVAGRSQQADLNSCRRPAPEKSRSPQHDDALSLQGRS